MTMKRYNFSEIGDNNGSGDILPAGTLVVDSDNNLRLHDGTTVGGKIHSRDRIVNGDFALSIQSNGSIVAPGGDATSTWQGQILSSNESSFINLDVQFDSDVTGGVRLGTGSATPVDIVTFYGGLRNTWRFDANGNLTVPGDISTRSLGFSFNTSITNISLDGTDVFVDLADNVFDDPINGRVTISGVIGMTEANATWYYEATNPNQFILKTDGTYSTNVDGSAWGSYSSGGTAVSGGYKDLNVNVGENQWTFTEGGNLILSTASRIISGDNNPISLSTQGGAVNIDNWGYPSNAMRITNNVDGESIIVQANGDLAQAKLRWHATSDSDYRSVYSEVRAESDGVKIVNSDWTDLPTYNRVWTFGTDGDLVLPEGKTIRDTAGTDLLAGGSGLQPPYKGFRAHYGSMYNNNNDPNGPINKLVIYKDSVTPSSTIDASTQDDTFTVTGLTGSDVVAMLVVISNNITQTATADLKTFVEAIIDNVILVGGVEGNVNTASDMKDAFYANFNDFNSIIPSVKTGFEFYDNGPLNYYMDFGQAVNSGSGSGLSIGNIRWNPNTSQFDNTGGSNGGPGGYQVNDTIVIPGTAVQDYQNNYLSSPANDITITITTVQDGTGIAQGYTITGTVPYTQGLFPSNSINDGGDDEYDTGNYINTDLAQEISYGGGNVVSGASEFGGGDYVVTYQAGIFGVFAVNANINSVGTSGGSGFDGDGMTATGGLYGDNTPTTPVITWTSPNDNVWRIEEYNGGAAVTYNGNDYDAKWFDVANSPGGNNHFRGAIIQYHALASGGTIIGTIHLSNDYTQQSATHTEHMSGNNSLQFVTLWDCNHERGQLYFKTTNGSGQDLLIQWTAKIFYGYENHC
jgi:hypothetical protein